VKIDSNLIFLNLRIFSKIDKKSRFTVKNLDLPSTRILVGQRGRSQPWVERGPAEQHSAMSGFGLAEMAVARYDTVKPGQSRVTHTANSLLSARV
jgi:hypothetical protein